MSDKFQLRTALTREETSVMTQLADISHIRAPSLTKISAKNRFSLLVDAVDNLSVYMLDADGRVVTWNSGAKYNKGYGEEEIIGKEYSIFFEPAAIAAGEPSALLDRAARDGRVDAQGWRVRKDGSRFWASVHVAAIRNPKGELLGYAKVTRDSSKEHQRKSLERARDRAVRENKAKADLLARTSHEMRTLLNAIVGYTDALCVLFDKMTDAKRLEYLAIVNQSSHGLLNLINDILETRKTVSSVHISKDPVDLTQVCMRVANEFLFTGRLGEKALLYVERNSNAYARCDEARLAQVLRNLVANALKFGGVEVKVIVSLEVLDNEYIRIAVDDDGAGVPLEEQEKIFRRYYRGRAARDVEGLGMGLALCRELLLQMDGAIGVSRAPLGGARFWVTLPRVDPTAKAHEQTDMRQSARA